MNILYNFINNPGSMHGTDYRAKTLYAVCLYLKKKGHTIYIDPHKKSGHHSFKLYPKLLKEFKRYRDDDKNKINLWLACYAHSGSHHVTKPNWSNKKFAQHKFFLEKKIPILAYEHGFLNESVLVDRNKLFSDSQYANNIKETIDHGFNINKCEEYRHNLVVNHISKRPQDCNETIPRELIRKYIFVPVQKIDDVSVTQYSKTGMLKFMSNVVHFAKEHNMPVIFKPHPHVIIDREPIAKHIANLKKIYPEVYSINASIYSLMYKSLFTACINSGGVVDNFISLTPVFCCGKSIFHKSGSVVFNNNVDKGLTIMKEEDYDWEYMKEKQLKMLWWLKNNLLFANLKPKENVLRLQKHAGIKLI